MSETRCARHPEASARAAPCERCGDFLCEECFADEGATCARCRERTGADRIAWEQPGRRRFRAHVATTLDLMLSPFETGARISRGGSLGRALAYWVAVPALLALLQTAWTALVAGHLPGVAALTGRDTLGVAVIAMLPVTFVLWSLLLSLHALGSALAFHLVASALGGRGPLLTSLRAGTYLSGLFLWLPLALAAGVLPLLGGLVLLVALLALASVPALVLYAVAREAHALEGGRAWVAALAPLLVSTALFALVVSAAAFVASTVAM